MGGVLPVSARAVKRALWKLRPVRSLQNLRRARRDAAQLDPRRPDAAPILVYQMAKVGSTTVQATLDHLDPPRRPCIKVHFLSPEGVRRERALDRRLGGPGYWSYYGAIGVVLGARLRRVVGRFPLPVISLVRDPIAREVSAVFQSPELAETPLRDATGRFDAERVLAHLERHFEGADPCGGAERWFDEELRRVLGVDVFAEPFPKQRGYAILRRRDARVLLLRTEDLDQTLGPALAEFLDLPKPPAVVSSNQRERSGDAEDYARVLSRFRLSRGVVDRIYAGRLARHFYPAEAIERFASRWSGG